MAVVKVFAAIIIFLTLGMAFIGQIFELRDPATIEADKQAEIQASAAQPVLGTDAPADVTRHAGAVVCKFDPVTDSPQQFAADYLFGELMREGDIYTFNARVAVPNGGYTVSFGPLSLVGTQAILEARLNRPSAQALEMIDAVPMTYRMRLPAEALTLRVVLRRPFAWGPDSIICSIMRPASALPAPMAPAPVGNPPPATP